MLFWHGSGNLLDILCTLFTSKNDPRLPPPTPKKKCLIRFLVEDCFFSLVWFPEQNESEPEVLKFFLLTHRLHQKFLGTYWCLEFFYRIWTNVIFDEGNKHFQEKNMGDLRSLHKFLRALETRPSFPLRLQCLRRQCNFIKGKKLIGRYPWYV